MSYAFSKIICFFYILQIQELDVKKFEKIKTKYQYQEKIGV